MALAERKRLGLDVSGQQRVPGLKAGHRRDSLQTGALIAIAVRHANESDLAFTFEFGKRVPCCFERFGVLVWWTLRPHRPSELVEIDHVNLEPPKAGFGLATKRVRVEAVRHVP